MSLREDPARSSHHPAANRLNALKSVGPRTKAGKCLCVLNLQWRRLGPEVLEHELRARGEDPGNSAGCSVTRRAGEHRLQIDPSPL